MKVEPRIQENSTAAGSDLRNRVQAVVEDVVRRRNSGESLSDDKVLAAFPELTNVLVGELAKLRLIEAAGIRADAVPSSGTNSAGQNSTPHTPGQLRIRCPHCREPFDVSSDTPFTDFVCQSCGSHFGLTGPADEERDAAALQKLAQFNLVERIGMG